MSIGRFLWKLTEFAGLLYFVLLLYFLFAGKTSARAFVSSASLALTSTELGSPLVEGDYASDCTLSSSNLEGKLDFFVLAHIAGWWGKSFILRDAWILHVLSVLFEVMEISLAFQLPNFKECWWDSLLMDIVICNGGGILLGLACCRFFGMQMFDWRAAPFRAEKRLKKELSGKQPMAKCLENRNSNNLLGIRTFQNYLVILFVLATFLVAEVDAFYLKTLLWIPPSHVLNWMRMWVIAFMGLIAISDIYYYATDVSSRLGFAARLMTCLLALELLVVVSFSRGEFSESVPDHVLWMWCTIALFLFSYAVLQFANVGRF